MEDSERNYIRIYYSKFEKYLNRCTNVFLVVCIFVVFCFAFFNSFFIPAEVNGLSMYPTINSETIANPSHKEICYYSKLFKINKGDIVIVDLPTREDDGIKRLIATGGDKISFGNINLDNQNKIYINGKELDEPYLIDKSKNLTCVNSFKSMIKDCLNGNEEKLKSEWLLEISKDNYEITLPSNYCIYLGDNRSVSLDCSYFGPQECSNIKAKVIMVIPYGYNVITYYWSKFLRLFA